jgi:hypothetical protein
VHNVALGPSAEAIATLFVLGMHNVALTGRGAAKATLYVPPPYPQSTRPAPAGSTEVPARGCYS